MRYPLIRGLVSVAVLSALFGCASPLDETSNAMLNAERKSDEGSSRSAAEKPAERTAEKTTTADKSTTAESPRRDERPAAAAARDNRGGTDTGRDELITQLNDASRELATLRAANAKLRAERASPSSSTSSSSAGSRAEPADDKLNTTLRSYTQFKQELANVVADMEKLRAENTALTTQVKELKARSDQNAAAAVARLEKELQAERAARAEAERTAGSLREQLRAVARAVNAAAVAPEGSGSTSRSSGR